MRSPRSIFAFGLCCLCFAVSPLHSEAWQAPALAGLEYVEVQRPVLSVEAGGEEPLPTDPETSFGPLPPKILSLLGPSAIDYPSFVAAYVAPAQVGAIQTEADDRPAGSGVLG